MDFLRRKRPGPGFASRGLLALALDEAEQGLDELPLTGEVMQMQTRLVAMKTVCIGLFQGVPKLTDAQRAKFVVEALTLANDVTRERTRRGG